MTLDSSLNAPGARPPANADEAVVDGFGDEWTRFDQSKLSDAEREAMFETYFHIFPWADLPPDPAGLDVGCGSGRWARLVAPRVGTLHCVDASEGALVVARANLSTANNCVFHHSRVDEMPIAKGSMDFGYCLGVLHHIPDTQAGMKACTEKLKAGAPFLVYLYYAFDNRPAWFKLIWRMSDFIRRIVAVAPHPIRYALSQVLAVLVYWPLARAAAMGEAAGLDVRHWPLSDYRRRSFYTMRTDALDRFGTRLEKRFTRLQIEAMMRAAGLGEIRFSDKPSFWCAVGIKQEDGQADG